MRVLWAPVWTEKALCPHRWEGASRPWHGARGYAGGWLFTVCRLHLGCPSKQVLLS